MGLSLVPSLSRFLFFSLRTVSCITKKENCEEKEVSIGPLTFYNVSSTLRHAMESGLFVYV